MLVKYVISNDYGLPMSKPKKRCTKCREIKALEEFWCLKASPDGHDWRCIECSKGTRDVRRTRASGKRWRLRAREAAIKRYGGKCVCCRERMSEFLAVVEKYKERSPRWLKENSFPTGCRVLCFNCLGAETTYGYCPHQPMI